MSADNWAFCPECVRKVEQARADLLTRIATDYGEIPADEYMALVEQSRRPLEEIKMPSLREDWGIGIIGDVFSVYYGATCEECGFSYAYRHAEKVSDDAD